MIVMDKQMMPLNNVLKILIRLSFVMEEIEGRITYQSTKSIKTIRE